MRTFLLVLSFILLMCWVASVLVYAVGGLLHILLVLAVITFVFSRRKKKKASIDELEKSSYRKE
jgi:hypothetical protein